MLDSFSFLGDNKFHTMTFTAPSTGTFKIEGALDILNKPSAILAAETRSSSYTSYFYVPADTPSILIEVYNSDTHPTSYLYDPDGNLVSSITGGSFGGVNDPMPGLWKFTYGGDTNAVSRFRLFGVPDLIGYRPQYLLVEGPGTPEPPVLDAIGNKSAHPDMLLQFTVSATAPNGDDLTYSASNLPSWASFNPATRTFSGTPDQTGEYTGVHFEVSDGEFTDSEDITISVTTNHTPTLVNPGDKSVDEGETLSFTVTATDPDGDPLTYSAGNLPSGASFNPATRTFSWTPSYTQAGTYHDIGFSATDGQLSSSQYITITVDTVNPPPVFDFNGSLSVPVGDLLTFTISGNDPDGDPLTYSAGNLPAGASFNPSTRIFSWTPVDGQEGRHQNIQFTAEDASLTDTETITITVNSNPDIDGDGYVNTLDLIRITMHWGETGSNGWIVEDVNNDGKINVWISSLSASNGRGSDISCSAYRGNLIF